MKHLQEVETAPEALPQKQEPIEESRETAPQELETLEALQQPFHQDLLEQLNHRSDQIRDTAVKAALSLPPEQVIELIKQEAEYHRKRYQHLLKVTLAGYVALILGSLLCSSDLKVILCIIAVGCSLMPLLIGWIDRLSKRSTRAIDSLSRVIGAQKDSRVLAQAMLLTQENYLRDRIGNILQVPLRSLKYEQSAQWTRKQKAALLLPLKNPYENMLLTEAVLIALQQVGDETAIPLVQRLATAPTFGKMGDRIRMAATECLPFLHQKANAQRQSQQLLRASGIAEAVDPTHLLHPAASGATVPPDQLLRPGDSGVELRL